MTTKMAKKGKQKTPSFVLELPLRTTPAERKTLQKRLDAGRQIYNAALGEGLRRLDLMRQSKAWQAARKLTGKAERAKAFKTIQAEFEFSWVALQYFTRDCRNNCWIKDHVGSQETQAITRRAFRSIEKYLYERRQAKKKSRPPVNGMPSRGRPQFKTLRYFDSVENQCNNNGMKFVGGRLIWGDLSIKPMLDPRDADEYQKEAMTRRIKFSRVLRKELRGRPRWYLQLVLEGTPPRRRIVGDGVVGVSIGPDTIAAVGDSSAMQEPLCPTVQYPWKKIAYIDRVMDRSRRASNPSRHTANGIKKRSDKPIIRTKRYLRLAAKKREIERRLTAERKRAHGELANRILGQGKEICLGKNSYRKWQISRLGRKLKVRAPALLVAVLKRKAQAVGGAVTEISLQVIAHTQRKVDVDVDLGLRSRLTQAFLTRYCGPEHLGVSQAIKAWPGAEPLLCEAASRYANQQAGSFCLPHMHKRGGADRLTEGGRSVG